MLELYVIRHGFAGKSLDDEAMDEKRSLKKKGKEMIKAIAKSLEELKIKFDHVLTSPLVRAAESAAIINSHCGKEKEAIVTDFLKPCASHVSLIKILNKLKNSKKIAIVGHEPFLSIFASYCLTNNPDAFINIKKSGILMLEIDGVIKPGKCSLSWLMEPRHLSRKNA